jgi:hypothetical protein
LQALADKTVNPQGEIINAYAIAPYFGGTNTTELASDIPDEATLVQNHVACLKGTCQRDQEPPPWTANPHARCRLTWTAG